MPYFIGLHILDENQPLPLLHGGTNTSLQLVCKLVGYHQLVDQYLNAVIFIPVYTHARNDLPDLPIYAHVEIAFFADLLKELFIMSLSVSYHRGEDVYFFADIFFQNQLQYLLIAVFYHFLPGDV